jgi:hypothetical protein
MDAPGAFHTALVAWLNKQGAQQTMHADDGMR